LVIRAKSEFGLNGLDTRVEVAQLDREQRRMGEPSQ
jgi:hypothetical protein